MIIDATDLVMGRLASTAAKKALLGETVDIVNCEKAVITGLRENVLAKYWQKAHRATIRKGPFISRMPDRFVRRIIRGMLPYKFEKGEKAFKRVMCYIGVPSELAGKKIESIKNADIKIRHPKNFVTVAEVCKELGAKI